MFNLYLIQMLKIWGMLVIKKMMHGVSFNLWRNWGNVVIKHECKEEIWIMAIVLCSQVINIQWKHKNILRWHVLVWSKVIMLTWGEGCRQVWHVISFLSYLAEDSQMVQTNNVAYARFMYSKFMASLSCYHYNRFFDTFSWILELDVAIELIKKQEPDDEYLTPVHGAKVHSAQNVNRITRYDLVVDHFPRKLQNSKNLQRCKYEECKRK